MIKNLFILQSKSLDARVNQAVEAALISMAKAAFKNSFILYLWANDNAVFIGKNQNAYLECDIALLEKEGGVLCRRITGGGAVYHDAGNLNYTFIAPRCATEAEAPNGCYDEKKQFQVVINAIKSMGIDAELSGRNDMTVQGRKFSGNAFYKDNETGMHHGTLLIKSDYQKIARYLTAGKIKLKSKGVESVAVRVINLCEVAALCTINKENISRALIQAVSDYIKLSPHFLTQDDIDKNEFDRWYAYFRDQKRLYGDDVYYDARIEHRFDWGTADIRLKMDGGRIVKARIYSDGLNARLIESKENALAGEDIYDIKNIETRDIIEVFKATK